MICYRITNLITNKSYVGVTTVGIDRRFKQHCWAAISGEQNILYKAMRKYGIENFIVEELAHAIGEQENLYALEKQVVAQEKTEIPNGYNMTSGGESPPSQLGKPSRRKGVKISEEEKQNLKMKADLTKSYLTKIEQPLFRSAEDMEEILAPTLFGNLNKSESVHGNSES